MYKRQIINMPRIISSSGNIPINCSKAVLSIGVFVTVLVVVTKAFMLLQFSPYILVNFLVIILILA